MRAVKYNFLMWPCIDSISTVTTAIIYVVGISWISGELYGVTVGVLIAFSSYISRFWEPINTLASFYNSLLTAIAYLERIFETIDEPVNVKDAPDAVPMPPINGEVRFQNVCFSYEDGVQILNNVNFTAKPGDTYAIVGPTGAGKSTIVNLLLGFYETEKNRIQIDGKALGSFEPDYLRSRISVVFQDSFLFYGTVKDNIRMARPEASDAEIMQAAMSANAHEFIVNLPNGYDTLVGERGATLSGGERQRIAIARAILKNAPILILDEATSSVDCKNEQEIQNALKEAMKDRTTLVIAHRMTTIEDADRIYVMQNGCVEGCGTHEELLQKDQIYQNLVRAQSYE